MLFLRVLKKKIIFLSLAVNFSANYTIDNAHFYRAAYFWGEPRLEQDWLFSADTSVGFSSTRTSRNSSNEKTPLLNLFGPFNMQDLGKNLPNLDPNSKLDKILIDLQNLPDNDEFGHLEFDAKFSMVEGVVSLYQNFTNGFFCQAYLPIRKLKINNISYKDLSPTNGQEPNESNPVWQEFLSSFDEITNKYGIDMHASKNSGAGDLSLLLGWTINYQETTHVDYVDISSKIGVLFPTGKTKNENKPFELPTGYNGYYGLPVFVQGSFGSFEWLTLGGHVGALFFYEKTKKLRVKTAAEQNGLIKLAQELVQVDPGTIWTFGSYIKADHISAGLSALCGYSFNKKENDTLFLKNPADSTTTNLIINSDPLYHGWNMHVLNLLVEYDFAYDPNKLGWRLGLFYNRILAGKRVFNAQVKAFNIGLDAILSW